MTDKLMSDNTLRTAYGITGEDATWDNTFSSVSVENILLYIVAVCAYSLEVMFDAFVHDVDDRIASNIVPTVRWYHSQALNFQYGDQLIYDKDTYSFRYPVIDDTKRLIKYCAVQDAGNTIQMLVSGDVGGKPSVISGDVLTAFRRYINEIKIAGILIVVRSLPSDRIKINAKITVNPMIIASDGVRISDGSRAVEDAINKYLINVIYGGIFNKTKLVDAIQAVEGVVDIELGTVQAKVEGGNYMVVTGNNYMAESGSFISDNLKDSIDYVVQN